MIRSGILFIGLLACLEAIAQHKDSKEGFQYFIDLTRVDSDRLHIELITPKLTEHSISYHVPAIVPGTYAIYNFGRYISHFRALTKKGDTLAVVKPDVNTWTIEGADKLAQITYDMDDTWDSPEIKGEKIFEPAGTNIEDKKAFMLNMFGFAGYFDGPKTFPYEVTFTKPASFYGATALIPVATTPTTEKYSVANYHDLADAPIMFTEPDTAMLKIGGADILIAIYSPNKKASADSLAVRMKTMLEAQKEYLGGTLPVRKYAFIIALTDNHKIFSYGALEHSYSSFYFIPEWLSPEKLATNVIDEASHEFFHILTPLSVHSHEIGEFDFSHPAMSEHLWLYEGITEYEAQHMQVKYQLITFPEFLKRFREKILTSHFFNDSVPFTVMSKGVLDKYKEQFVNVYMKGALINFCLDVKLRALSGGKYGTQDMMRDLSKKYGKDRAFNDAELFDTITALTFPPIRSFFADYVEGSKPLPLAETFASIGVRYTPKLDVIAFRMGIQFNLSDTLKHPVVVDVANVTPFGGSLGLQEKDVVVSINQVSVSPANLVPTMDSLKLKLKEGDDFSMAILRKDAKGKQQTVVIKQPVKFVKSSIQYDLTPFPDPTPEQLALRAAWLNTSK